MIDYNDMINLVNMIYGVKPAGTGQSATPPAHSPMPAAPMPAAPMPATPMPAAPMPATPMPAAPMSAAPMPAAPMNYGQTPYTPVLPNALQAENDVLKDVIATLQRNALSNPVNSYRPETSGDILNNLINPPMTKE
jgi:hypothetical protein